ncbi:MAG TPA: RsmE family RNA methyltransferase [Nitrospiraceae bacterium]
MPIFFIKADQITNGTVAIAGQLRDHLHASLRVRPGERIWLGDEHRRRYLIDVTHVDRRELRGSVVEERIGPAPSAPRLVIGQSILKNERMDWAIQKATELGADVIVPLVSEQTVVRPKEGRVSSQQERWQRIALESAQQSERWDVPAVGLPVSASDFFATPDVAVLKLILAERGTGQSLNSITLPSSSSAAIAFAIGPEGGWRDEELAGARTHNFLPVTLGARILRADTAALAALSILQNRLGELG